VGAVTAATLMQFGSRIIENTFTAVAINACPI